MSTDPRYPIGRLARRPSLDADARLALIADIEALPAALEAAIAGLDDAQLDTPYREGGWTLRQVVHHLADSHVNAYVRFRLAATADSPRLVSYDEAVWAGLADARSAPPALSIALLSGLHARWGLWLRSLPEATFARQAIHPENGPQTIDTFLQIYGWHGRHHVAQITSLRAQRGW